MAVGENETVSVDPVWVLGVELHLPPHGVGGGGQTEGGTGVAGVGLGHTVDSQRTDGGNGQLVDVRHYGSEET